MLLYLKIPYYDIFNILYNIIKIPFRSIINYNTNTFTLENPLLYYINDNLQ